jgi:hypothetical protein
LAAIRAGFGVGFTTCWLGDTDPHLVRLFPPEQWTDLWLVYHQDLKNNARIRAFVEHMYTAISADADLFEGRRGHETASKREAGKRFTPNARPPQKRRVGKRTR